MSDITHILNALEQGDQQAAAELLPLIYDELRRLAGQKMAQEKAGHTSAFNHTESRLETTRQIRQRCSRANSQAQASAASTVMISTGNACLA
jgi:hypothetical protein